MKIQTILSAALMLVTAAATADAQVVVNPKLAGHGLVNPNGFRRGGVVVAPHGFFLPHRNGTVLGDHLRGAAAVRHSKADQVRARGEYLKNREIARQKAIANRRAANSLRQEEQKTRDEYYATLRRDSMTGRSQRMMQRYVFQPKTSVIKSGSALNYMLENLRLDPTNYALQSMTLSENDFDHISFQLADGFSLKGAGSLIDKTGYIVWPQALRGKEFAFNRHVVETLVADAMAAAQNGESTDSQLERLEEQLDAFTGPAVASMGTKAFRESKKFAKDLELTVNHLTDGSIELLSYRPTTLGDMLEYMQANNLTFAPTSDSGLQTYNRMHQTLAGQLNA